MKSSQSSKKRCVILSLTGQYIIAVFMALSQFIEPYSAEQAQKMLSEREAQGEVVPEWEKEIYKTFKPMHPNEIMKLSLEPLKAAQYLRSTCFLARGGLPYQMIEQAIEQQRKEALLEQPADGVGVLMQDPIQRIQSRLLPEEQEISIEKATDLVKLICDHSVPLSDLAKVKIRHGAFYYHRMHRTLQKINSLADLPKLPEVSFVKDSTGAIIGEYSKTEINADKQVVKRNRRRLPEGGIIPIKIKQAVVAIEDSRFWNFEAEGSPGYKGHKGVDFGGIIRAMTNSGSGNVQGASTITMQLAKNLLLYEDVFREHSQGKRSLIRKLKEYILSYRIEEALTKDEILNLYLNTIDFGRNTQGIVMAAQVYFNKNINDLNLSEIAFLAGLPKSPNGLDPEKNYEGAVKRRNLVLTQMRSEKYISRTERSDTKKLPLEFIPYAEKSEQENYAHFYVSAVEKQLKGWLRSKKQNIHLGFDITVPINHEYQKWAVEALQRGLLKYEREKGILTIKPDEDRLPNIKESVEALAAERGISNLQAFPEVLEKIKSSAVDTKQFRIGVILSNTKIGLSDGSQVNRQPSDRNGKLRKVVEGSKRNLEVWDTVMLQPFKTSKGNTYYRIASFTKAQGGIVVLDNLTGEVLATSGGFSIGAGKRYKGAAGNRAFSAFRRPGSTVKPFTYLFAMQNGVSPSASISNEAISLPRRIFNGERVCDKWTPRGYSNEASAYSLRRGLEKSKNKITVRAFARALGIQDYEDPQDSPDTLGFGMDRVLGLMQQYGLYSNLDYACYPALLGAEETTVVEMAGAYAAFANKGIYTTPYTINSVSRRGATAQPYEQKNVIDATIASAVKEADPRYQNELFNLFRLRTMLQGVVQRGTAASIAKWSKVIAGKTGTTKGNKDAWFVGFNKDITVAVWVGNVDNKSLGSKSEGGKVALPIFKDFMENYYQTYPDKLSNEFSNDVVGAVVANIEPSTGFRISNTFQSDFNLYTGSSRTIPSTKEYFSSNEEMRSQVRDYYRGSRAAGELF
ncbi:MAG: transglycosylase domain-containing protein, partial [Bdellovibrionales bacterium]